MGLTAAQIKTSLDAIAAAEPRFADALAAAGYPEPRIRERGYTTLLRTIVGQQVSVAAAASMWRKLEEKLGTECAPEKLLAQGFRFIARMRPQPPETRLCPQPGRTGDQWCIAAGCPARR